MAGERQFKTLFAIGAKWTGAPAVAKAQKSMGGLQKTAAAASRGIGSMAGGFTKLAGAIGVASAAYFALRKASEFWSEGVKASQDAVKVQEELGVAAERNAKRYRTSGSAIVKSMNAVTEKVAKVGFDSEDAAAGTTKLLESMSPREIEAFSQAYTDLVAKQKGAVPTAEGFADVSEQINSAILKGKAPWLAQLGATDKQIKALRKLAPAQRRAYLQQLIGNRLAGEANRVFDTTAGKVARAAVAYENLQQTITGPVVARTGEFADAQRELYDALQPTADLIAHVMEPGLVDLAQKVHENKSAFEGFGESAKTAWDKLIEAQNKSQAFFKPYLEATKTFFSELWANTQKEFDQLWPIIEKFGTDLWTNTLAEFEKLTEIVGWIDVNLIQPIAALFDWLVAKIQTAWTYIQPVWDKLNAATTLGTPVSAVGQGEAWQHRIPQASDFGGDTSAAQGPPSASLQEARARLGEELAANPATQAKMYKLAKAEWGGQGEQAIQAGMETMMNRAAARNQTLARTLQPDYYEPLRRGGGLPGLSPGEQERYARLGKAVVAGSDVSGKATGNWSGPAGQGLGGKGGYVTKRIGGEQFSVQAADKAWAARMKTAPATGKPTASLDGVIKELNLQKPGAAGPPINVSAGNNTVTINGVAPGREALMAKKATLALRDPLEYGLQQLKKMQRHELRPGYV